MTGMPFGRMDNLEMSSGADEDLDAEGKRRWAMELERRVLPERISLRRR